MKKLGIIFIGLILVSTAAFADVMANMADRLTIGGKVAFGAYAVVVGAADKAFYNETYELKIDASLDENNSGFVKFVLQDVLTKAILNTDTATPRLITEKMPGLTVDELKIVSKIGGWSGLTALSTLPDIEKGVGIDFTAGFYDPGAPKKNKKSDIGIEDVIGVNVGKAAGTFDVAVDLFGFAKVGAAVKIGNEDATNVVFFAESTLNFGDAGILAIAAYFGDGRDDAGLDKGEVGGSVGYDIAIGDISLGVGVGAEYNLDISLQNPPVQLGAGFKFGFQNWISAGVGFRFKVAGNGKEGSEIGLGFNVNASDPTKFVGVDVGATLALDEIVFIGAASNGSTFDMLDASVWVKPGPKFRAGFLFIPKNGGNIKSAYQGPSSGIKSIEEARGVFYLEAEMEF